MVTVISNLCGHIFIQSAKHCGRERGPNVEGQLGACLLSEIPGGQTWQRCWENPSAGRRSHTFATEFKKKKKNQALKKQTPVKMENSFKDDRQISTSIQNLIFFNHYF